MKKWRLPKKEKDEKICELLKQGKDYRYISKDQHVSFKDITRVKNKYFEVDDDDSAETSKRSKALTMMEEGESDLRIAIKLNITSDEIAGLKQEHLKLKGQDQLLGIYRRIGGGIEPFLELYEMMNKEGLTVQEAIWALQDYGSFESISKQFTHLTKKLRPLREQVSDLENEKQQLFAYIKRLTDEIDQLIIRRQNEGRILQAMTGIVDRSLNGSLQNAENTFEEPDGQLDLDWIGKSPSDPGGEHRGPYRRRKQSKIKDK
jgi:predicted ATPase